MERLTVSPTLCLPEGFILKDTIGKYIPYKSPDSQHELPEKAISL